MQKSNVERYAPHSSLREGAGTAVAVTEGASGQKTDCLQMGWYLLAGIEAMNFFNGMLWSNWLVLPAGGLPFLLRQERKESCPAQGGSNSLPLELLPP